MDFSTAYDGILYFIPNLDNSEYKCFANLKVENDNLIFQNLAFKN